MSRLEADAVLELWPSDEGGLAASIESGTRALILKFAVGAGEMPIGVAITTTDASPLTPGRSMAVKLVFWADEAPSLVKPGSSFVAWHGRDVGSGTVTAVR